MKRMIVYAMSRKLRDIGDDLDNKGKPLIRHLIKIALYPDHTSLNHWIDEIYSFLNQIDTYKGKNKAPSSDFIYNNLYSKGNYRYLYKWIKVIKQDYGDSDVSDYQVEQFVQNYIIWLSEELSDNLVVSKSSIRHKLMELIYMESR